MSIYIYCIFILHNTSHSATKCILTSCGEIYHIFIFSVFSLGRRFRRKRERKGLQRQCWKELDFYFLPASSQVLPFRKKLDYIRYGKSGEGRERPLRGHATSGGQQTNVWLSWERTTDRDDEEMGGSPSPCPRERGGLILAWWHTSRQSFCVPVVPPVRENTE